MNKKNKRSLFVIIASIGILLIGCIGIQHKKQDEFIAQPIKIDYAEQNTKGKITVYDNRLQEVFQYVGDIDIQNDGKNGDPIYIYVNLEDAGWTE